MKLLGSKFVQTGLILFAGAIIGAFAMAKYNSTNFKTEKNIDIKPQNQNYKNSNYYDEEKGDFDFYVLSLSWSPTFCIKHKKLSQSEEQCKSGSKKGFVVHGLWPQFEHGYPRSCPSNKSTPDNGLAMQMLDIMPSTRLVRLEWERHGTCSGLEPKQYFQTLRKAREKINIPNFNYQDRPTTALIEQEFVKSNPGLDRNGIAIIHNDNMMAEVRICLKKSLEFRPCEEVNSRAAKDYDKLFIPSPK
ncbi:MAG: ribonuclease T2 [Caulobacterales bacterium]|nr:ribonuclease T2 [Caulobacterales bacterium]MCA0372408.1 ribonuclease T2 [Pseudomonadota bacterium]